MLCQHKGALLACRAEAQTAKLAEENQRLRLTTTDLTESRSQRSAKQPSKTGLSPTAPLLCREFDLIAGALDPVEEPVEPVAKPKFLDAASASGCHLHSCLYPLLLSPSKLYLVLPCYPMHNAVLCYSVLCQVMVCCAVLCCPTPYCTATSDAFLICCKFSGSPQHSNHCRKALQQAVTLHERPNPLN